MSEVDSSVSDANSTGSASDESTKSSTAERADLVSYETYKRTLAEAKNAKARMRELEERLQSIETEKLGVEGKKDEVISSLKKQLEQKDSQYKQVFGNFAYQSLRAQVSEEAAKLGCVDTEALTKLIDLGSFEVDEDSFKADREQIKLTLEEARKKMPYLFSKPAPRIDAGIVRTTSTDPKTFNPKTASVEEIKAELKRLDQLARQ